jgi:hypothetical protein
MSDERRQLAEAKDILRQVSQTIATKVCNGYGIPYEIVVQAQDELAAERHARVRAGEGYGYQRS